MLREQYGYITGDTVTIVRKNGQIFDYVLPGEPVRDSDWRKSRRGADEITLYQMKKTFSRHKKVG